MLARMNVRNRGGVAKPECLFQSSPAGGKSPDRNVDHPTGGTEVEIGGRPDGGKKP